MAKLTCEQVIERIEENFGLGQLPAEITAHIKSCDQCRAFSAELAELENNMPGDASFAPTQSETTAAIDAVDRALTDMATESEQSSKQSSPVWRQMAMAASVVFLVVASGWVGRQLGQKTIVEVTSTNQSTDLFSAFDYDEPEGEFVDLLIDDYVLDRSYSATEELLDDLTDEELKYLEENFSLGELL